MSYYLSFLFAFFSFVITVNAQKTILLENPSLEGKPAVGKVPFGWENTGFENYSPPDIHPKDFFQVTQAAYDGNTYVGLLTRSNNTWEGIGQVLQKPIQANTCYYFSAYLCRSTSYVSSAVVGDTVVNYNNPVQLEIWGGTPESPNCELLAKSDGVVNTNWLQYQFKLSPSKRHRYLFLEAKNLDGSKVPYNGNLLIDHLSDLVPMDCQEKLKEVAIEEVEIATTPNDSILIAKRDEQNLLKPKPRKPKSHRFTLSKLNAYFERIQFIAFSDQLTEDSRLAINQLAELYGSKKSRLMPKIVIVKGQDEILENRINAIEEVFIGAGWDKKMLKVRPLYPSDLTKYWNVKNPYLWVKYTYK